MPSDPLPVASVTSRMNKLLVSTLLALVLEAHAETFTDKKNRSIEAEIVSATEKTVSLRLANGKIAKLAREKLIDENQELIDTWLKNALPKIKIDPKLARGLKKSDNTAWEKVQSFKLSLKIENDSRDKDLEDSEITAVLVGRADWNKKLFKILKIQTKTVKVAADGSETFNLDGLRNYYSKSYGFHALNYVIEVRRKRDGKLIYLSSDDGVLKKRAAAIIKLSEGDIVEQDFSTKMEGTGKLYSSLTVVDD